MNMISDAQVEMLSGTWKILLDCDSEIPSQAQSIASTSQAIWTMVSMEQDTISKDNKLNGQVKEYGIQSHDLLKELVDINTKLSALYVNLSIDIQEAKKVKV